MYSEFRLKSTAYGGRKDGLGTRSLQFYIELWLNKTVFSRQQCKELRTIARLASIYRLP